MNSVYRKNSVNYSLSTSHPDLSSTVGQVTKTESDKVKFCQNLISKLVQKYTHKFCIILPDDDQPEKPVIIRTTVSKSKRKEFEQNLKTISQRMPDNYEIRMRSSRQVEDQLFSIEPTVSHSVSHSLEDASFSASYQPVVSKSRRVKNFLNKNSNHSSSVSSMDMIEPIAKNGKNASKFYKINKI